MRWPRSDGAGALVALFLGGFVAWLWFEIFVGHSLLACAKDESTAGCARTWIGIFLTPAGVGVSAWLIVRQIRISRAQLVPPAIQYLDQVNSNIAQLRFLFNKINAYAGDTPKVLKNLLHNLPLIIPKIIEAVDVDKSISIIISCHLEHQLHDDCLELVWCWNEYCEALRRLQSLVITGRFDAKHADAQSAIEYEKESTQSVAAKIQGEFVRLQPMLDNRFLNNQHRLIELGWSITSETDSPRWR